jgi:hypothetical protein
MEDGGERDSELGRDKPESSMRLSFISLASLLFLLSRTTGSSFPLEQSQPVPRSDSESDELYSDAYSLAPSLSKPTPSASSASRSIITECYIYDHSKTRLDVLMGESLVCAFTFIGEDEDTPDATLKLGVGYAYAGDALREGTAAVSYDGYAWGVPVVVPTDPVFSALLSPLSRASRSYPSSLYVLLSAVSGTGMSSLTMDVAGILYLDGSTPLYDGKSGAGYYPFVRIEDVLYFHSTWMEIEQEEMYVYRYDVGEGGDRSFQVDLRYVFHDMDLYGRMGSVPSIDAYDWKATNGDSVTGTLVTEQSMSAGTWYVGVYGENVIWPATTATTSLEMSFDGGFESGSSVRVPALLLASVLAVMTVLIS